jgi:hypothetical protein
MDSRRCFRGSLEQWRHYLEGSLDPIQVLTDHDNLKAFNDIKHLNGRQARWAIFLSGLG